MLELEVNWSEVGLALYFKVLPSANYVCGVNSAVVSARRIFGVGGTLTPR